MAAVTAAILAIAGCDSDLSPGAAASPISGRPSTSMRTSRTPRTSASTKAAESLARLLAKLPHFPAAPLPVPIYLPIGPTAPIYYRLPVHAPVAFLTIDDGLDQLPQDLTVMRAAHVPFTMFLIGPVAARNPSFFKRLEGDGGMIENHTLTHPILRGRTYAFQKNEVCGGRALLAQTFGRTPVLFRPPYGDYDQTTLRVVHDCGLQAAFYWSETVNNGKVRYQTSIHKIKPGDIILMHFRPAFAVDVLAALTAIHRAGLTPALLEDYIAPGNV